MQHHRQPFFPFPPLPLFSHLRTFVKKLRVISFVLKKKPNKQSKKLILIGFENLKSLLRPHYSFFPGVGRGKSKSITICTGNQIKLNEKKFSFSFRTFNFFSFGTNKTRHVFAIKVSSRSRRRRKKNNNNKGFRGKICHSGTSPPENDVREGGHVIHGIK